MPNFGIIVVKNPGPDTELSIEGLSGCNDDMGTFTEAEQAAEAYIAQGHKAWPVVAFEPDESDGNVQVEMYDREMAARAGCLTDAEIAADEAKEKEEEAKT